MRRVLPIALLVLTLAPAQASAVTAREILELSRAGLGEEVLLALIEVDGGVFTMDTETIKSLKQAGVSERVILAMVRSGRETINAPAPEPQIQPMDAPALAPADLTPPPPQVVVIEHDRPYVQQIAVPVYIPVVPSRRGVRSRVTHVPQPFDPSPGFGVSFNQITGFGVPVEVQEPVHQEPVYWGWGGKLRPDAWNPGKAAAKPDHGRTRGTGGKRD